jgi:acyl carrier protein
MINNNKLNEAFAVALSIPIEMVVDTLSYESIPEWDSIAHMALVTELESVFNVMLDTDDILGLSSVSISRDILGKYGIEF